MYWILFPASHVTGISTAITEQRDAVSWLSNIPTTRCCCCWWLAASHPNNMLLLLLMVGCFTSQQHAAVVVDGWLLHIPTTCCCCCWWLAASHPNNTLLLLLMAGCFTSQQHAAVVVDGWLLHIPTTRCCCCWWLVASHPSNMLVYLLRQLYVLPCWDRSCRWNFLPHPLTVYWHLANQFQCWPYYARRLAGQPLECKLLSHWYDPTQKNPHRASRNPTQVRLLIEVDALTTKPTGRFNTMQCISHGQIAHIISTCCHTETEAANHTQSQYTCYFTQSQYTDTRPTSSIHDPVTPGAAKGCPWRTSVEVTDTSQPGRAGIDPHLRGSGPLAATPPGMGIKNGKVSWKVGAAEGPQWGSRGQRPRWGSGGEAF